MRVGAGDARRQRHAVAAGEGVDLRSRPAGVGRVRSGQRPPFAARRLTEPMAHRDRSGSPRAPRRPRMTRWSRARLHREKRRQTVGPVERKAPPVLPDAQGRPVQRSPRARWSGAPKHANAALEAAGRDERVPTGAAPCDLRPCCAIPLIEHHGSVNAVRKCPGHSQPSVTRDTYARLRGEDGDTPRDAVEAAPDAGAPDVSAGQAGWLFARVRAVPGQDGRVRAARAPADGTFRRREPGGRKPVRTVKEGRFAWVRAAAVGGRSRWHGEGPRGERGGGGEGDRDGEGRVGEGGGGVSG
ncbi:hypothetical protein SUDANB6_01198 [Streptomyces sp. enrichment culture]